MTDAIDVVLERVVQARREYRLRDALKDFERGEEVARETRSHRGPTVADVRDRGHRPPVRVVLVRAHACWVAAAAFLGCATPEAVLPRPAIADSAGLTIVENSRLGWRGVPWMVASEPSVSIGVLAGTPDLQLFDIRDAARQSDGTIVVVDESRTVRRFDATGRFVGRSGGPGGGPGEFEEPADIRIAGNDAIVVWDARSYRISRLDRVGSFEEMHPLPLDDLMRVVEPPLYPGSGLLLDGGKLLLQLASKGPVVGKAAALRTRPAGEQPHDRTYRERSGALIVSPGLADVDTLAFFDGNEMALLPPEAGSVPIPPAGAATTSVVARPDGRRVCVGTRATPEVRCFDPDGAATIIRWSDRPVPLSASDVDAWREAAIESWGPKMSRSDAASLLAEVATPESRPAYGRIVLDRAGNLWVQRRGDDSSTAHEYLVFDRGGIALGPVLLPPVRILEIGEDYVLGVHRDELEVEYLHLYPLVKAAG